MAMLFSYNIKLKYIVVLHILLLPLSILLVIIFNEKGNDLNENDPIITIINGKIRGKSLKNIFNRTYYVFLDIPYAKPPVGNLRFQEPRKLENWQGILDKTENRKKCWEAPLNELTRFSHLPEENEDCLNLNVFLPKLPKKDSELLPVIVYIYGGGFASGDDWPSSGDPQLLVDNGIIYVNFNYRSGPLGFLTTDDRVIPANVGLKDQNFVLKWVQDNIIYFGGDPKKVTLMGESSGAALVAYQLLNRQSAGLFRSAVIQSGSPLMHDALFTDSQYYAYELGKKLSPDFSNKNSTHDLLKLLQSVPAKDIAETYMPFRVLPDSTFISKRLTTPFGPIIENPNDTAAIITGPMHDDFLNGNFNKVPVLMGVTSEEILSYFKEVMIENWAKYMDASPDAILFPGSNVLKEDRIEYSKKLKSIYTNTSFQDEPIAMLRYLSDAIVKIGTIRQADLQSKYTDVYFYQFSYYGEKNYWTHHPINIEGMGNAGHCAELGYFLLLGPDRMEKERLFPAQDIIIRDRLVRMWSNFVKYMDPTPEPDPMLENIYWPKFRYDNFTYLDIDKNFTVINKYIEPYKQWVSLIDQYHQRPMSMVC